MLGCSFDQGVLLLGLFVVLVQQLQTQRVLTGNIAVLTPFFPCQVNHYANLTHISYNILNSNRTYFDLRTRLQIRQSSLTIPVAHITLSPPDARCHDHARQHRAQLVQHPQEHPPRRPVRLLLLAAPVPRPRAHCRLHQHDDSWRVRDLHVSDHVHQEPAPLGCGHESIPSDAHGVPQFCARAGGAQVPPGGAREERAGSEPARCHAQLCRTRWVGPS